MDALIPQASDIEAYGQAVWSCPRDAGVNPRVTSPGDGGKKARFTGESTEQPLKPSCRECRSVSAYLW